MGRAGRADKEPRLWVGEERVGAPSPEDKNKVSPPSTVMGIMCPREERLESVKSLESTARSLWTARSSVRGDSIKGMKGSTHLVTPPRSPATAGAPASAPPPLPPLVPLEELVVLPPPLLPPLLLPPPPGPGPRGGTAEKGAAADLTIGEKGTKGAVTDETGTVADLTIALPRGTELDRGVAGGGGGVATSLLAPPSPPSPCGAPRCQAANEMVGGQTGSGRGRARLHDCIHCRSAAACGSARGIYYIFVC